MGIRVDFFIKHVRPYGTDAYELITTPGPGTLTQWLLDNGVDQATINVAYNSWALAANAPVEDWALPVFTGATQTISQARWSQLYQTNYSTIMFLNEPLIKELSYASTVPGCINNEFSFRGTERIPVAVTINRWGNQPKVDKAVPGADVASDAQGNCCHFDRLLYTD
jgi:hypothetical protein